MVQPGYYMPYNPQYQPVPQMQPYQMPMQPSGPMPGPNGLYPPAQQQQQFLSFNPPPQQMVGQFYPPMPHPQQISPQTSNMSSPVLGNAAMARPQPQSFDQAWGQASFPNQVPNYNGMSNPFQSPMQPVMPNSAMGNTPMPYPYGQLPFSSDTQSARNAHPVPGSFNRQNLNPQTRSFVPGAGLNPASGTDQASRMGAAPSFPTGPASFAQPTPLPAATAPFVPAQGNSNNNPTPSRKQNNRNANAHAQSPPRQSTLSKWGTPSTLPPKPPPPASPRASSNGSTLAGPSHAALHNGTYPTAGPSPQETKAS